MCGAKSPNKKIRADTCDTWRLKVTDSQFLSFLKLSKRVPVGHK